METTLGSHARARKPDIARLIPNVVAIVIITDTNILMCTHTNANIHININNVTVYNSISGQKYHLVIFHFHRYLHVEV